MSLAVLIDEINVSMRLTRFSMTGLMALWIIVTIFYYNANVKQKNKIYKNSHDKNDYKIKQAYIENAIFFDTHITTKDDRHKDLINTPGCVIPDYSKTMVFKEAKIMKRDCGVRAIFVNKVSDDMIVLRIDNNRMNTYRKGKPYKCCYQFISRPTSNVTGIRDNNIKYSECKQFDNGAVTELKEEIIKVTCGVDPVKLNHMNFYKDVYIIVKKRKNIKKKDAKAWNVLILGMDTMSRARAFATMPQTINHLQENGWADYRGYTKVGYNTFPNLAAILGGSTNIYSSCRPSMDHCNDLLIWSKYKMAGYVTAYGEDYLNLPDTFKNYGGFETPPTDHYMRPLFLLGESYVGNLVCTRNLPSAQHVLGFAYNFTQTYKDENFFGMFWINSCSHNLNNAPTLCDTYTKHFFQNILNTGNTLNNTFIIFISDHGIRYGETRYQMESYYEERLPMFFMWVPHEFRKRFPIKYANLRVNQWRLTTPYDLHATLWEILKISEKSVTTVKPGACPHCTSLFEKKSDYRTCSDAKVDKKWCSCYKMQTVDSKDISGRQSLNLAVISLKNKTNTVKTIECTKCKTLKLKTVVRIHSYYDSGNKNTYYVVAFMMTPGNVGYEVTIEKNMTGFKVVEPISTITVYNTRGDCVQNKLRDRPFCVCERIPKCHKNK